MASVRDLRKRIKSVKSTQKITKAMKMVAAARLRKAQEAAEKSNPYSKVINDLFADLSADESLKKHPLFNKREVKQKLVLVFSSDRGLCGSFNSSSFKKALELLKDESVKLYTFGRKADSFFKRKYKNRIYKSNASFWENFDVKSAQELSKELAQLYIDKSFDEIVFIYNEFISIMNQEIRVETVLPLVATQKNKEVKEDKEQAEKPYLFEPGKEKILESLIPRALDVRVYRPCLHSLASEFGARMAAMDSATRNAGEMIDDLTLTMNRVRQANITRELVEIISGAEALG
ncbi:MAG TPA: ATP synthase F1 subunit gamma [Oligoflexia bacterium]|nr:ATP synthase F1 subunit gamma [Oligoflexia bacterium]HMR24350.1 ATP synthase F1 subunit gamma [Oligoflexia bacterium]